MKESHRKGVATILTPSHARAVARLHLKRWTGAYVGWVLSSENGVWKRPGGANQRPARAHPSRGLSSATVEANLDPERRWAATTIGNRGAGRQSSTARGREGSQPDLGRGLSGFLVRIPAGAQST